MAHAAQPLRVKQVISDAENGDVLRRTGNETSR
jgi:hypothetical protein